MVQINRTIVIDVILAVPIAIAGGAGLYFWFYAAYLWEEHVTHDAQVPIPADGRIIPLENHGTIVYLTQAEHDVLYHYEHLGIGLLLLFGALSLTHHLVKRSRAKTSSSDPAM